MASGDEFADLLAGNDSNNNGNGGSATSEWMNSLGKQQQQSGSRTPPKSRPRPPQAPRPGVGEQSPLLQPPLPQSALAPVPPKQNRGHGRSRSEFVWTGAPPESSHPLKPPSGGNRPPRKASGSGAAMLLSPPPPQLTVSPLTMGSPKVPGMSRNAHRRAKSDIPLNLFGGDRSVGANRQITKADLLKSMPNPRWGGVAPSKSTMHTRQRSRTGSDHMMDDGSVKSGFSGYGATGSMRREKSSGSLRGSMKREKSSGSLRLKTEMLQSIGSVELGADAKKSNGRHVRAMSDASAVSVTTDMMKSALFKGVTDTGRIQLQLPKDSFRVLMDSALETGQVYKRNLVDDEDQFFVEFHTVDDHPHLDRENQRMLPPDLYVMAVDSCLYRRMLDEVIASKSMPCGLFFCGHHEDVRHPDITIAALLVGVVFILLLWGTTYFSS